jgi:DNA-binding XRE family transcriptional regulator
MGKPAGKTDTTTSDLLMQDIVHVAEVVESLGAKRRWNILALAKHAGKPHTTFNNWKKGHHPPSLATIVAFCSAVGAHVRLIVQDGASVTDTEGDPEMPSHDALRLARLFDELDHDDQIRVDAFVHALHAKPSSGTGPR